MRRAGVWRVGVATPSRFLCCGRVDEIRTPEELLERAGHPPRAGAMDPLDELRRDRAPTPSSVAAAPRPPFGPPPFRRSQRAAVAVPPDRRLRLPVGLSHERTGRPGRDGRVALPAAVRLA